MIYTVVWKPIAEQRLTKLWIAASNRQSVADATNRIDQRLRREPDQQGESRDAKRRILFVPPLAVLYRVEDDDRTLHVLDVWRV
jgi:hypothetical protein